MDLKELLELMNRFEQSASIMHLEAQIGGDSIKLSKAAQGAVQKGFAPAPAGSEQKLPPAADKQGTYIKAPLVGTFYAAASPGDTPFATVGSKISKGQTICIIEAMKMMSEIPAPEDCIIEEVLVENGAFVGFESPLFRVKELC